MKKRKPRLIALALLCLIAISAYVYCNYVRVQNVFDQMYFSRVYTDSIFSKLKNHRYLFENMPQLQSPSYDADSNAIWLGNMVFEHYDSKFLEDGHRIEFCFNMTSHILYIDYTVETEGGQEWYEYIYDVEKKSLTYKTSDPEDIKMKQFLFDRVLPDWFAANGSKTRFSLQNLGHYTLIDTTA